MKEKKKNWIRPEDVKVTKTSDVKKMKGKFLIHDLYRTWNEDFLDEDTGNTISIERKELVCGKGEITEEILQTIMFHLQAGDITEVEVSDVEVGDCSLRENFFSCPYLIDFRDSDGNREKCVAFADSILLAMKIVADYLAMERKKDGYITPAKVQVLSQHFIPYNEPCMEGRAEYDSDEFYEVLVKYYLNFDEEFTRKYCVIADDVAMAKERVQKKIDYDNEKLKEKGGNQHHYIIRKAVPFEVDFVVPQDFCMLYHKTKKDEKE